MSYRVSKLARHQVQIVYQIGLEASSTKCRLHYSRVIQHDISNPVLPISFKTSPHVSHPETQEGSGIALILLTQNSAKHDWQAVQVNPTYQESMQSKEPCATVL
jgi:hypothetical protein